MNFASLFNTEIEFGTVNLEREKINPEHRDGIFDLSVPEGWMRGFHHALFVKNFKDGSVKIIPVDCEEVAIIRMKSRDMASLQLAVQKLYKRLGLKSIFSNGLCVDVDCYTEFAVKKDRKIIDRFIEIARTEVSVEASVIIIFLDQKFRRLKELAVETGTSMWVNDFLNLGVKKDEIVMRLKGVENAGLARKMQELMINLTQNVLTLNLSSPVFSS